MPSKKAITIPLNPKARARACASTPEFPQDRYELLANATPSESDEELPFDD